MKDINKKWMKYKTWKSNNNFNVTWQIKMAASRESAASQDGWSKWQIGLAVGVPIVVVGGYLLYRRHKNNKKYKFQPLSGSQKKTSINNENTNKNLDEFPNKEEKVNYKYFPA